MVAHDNVISYFQRGLVLQRSLVVPTRRQAGLLSIEATGQYRLGPNVETPRVVALIDGAQRTMLPEQLRAEE